MEVIMRLVSKLLLIFFMLGLFSVYLPQKVLAEFSEAEKSSIQSFQLYLSKANQGDADAQFNLALLYLHGRGTPQDMKQAVYWLTKAAEQGFVNAKYSLGQMYKSGHEVPQDYIQAVYWYTKAAEQDHFFAKKNRDKVLEMMSQSQEDQKEKARQEAIARMERESLAREKAERREVERKRQAELSELERERGESFAIEEAARRENINRKWIPFLRTIEGEIWIKSRGIPCKLGKDLYVCLQNNDQDSITTENIKNKIIEAKQKEGRSVALFYTYQIPGASSITVAIYFKVNGNTLNVYAKQTCSGIFCGDREDSLFTLSLPYNEGPF
jgi:hypothetical protein